MIWLLIRRRNRKYKWEAQVRIKGFNKTYKSFKYKEHAEKWEKKLKEKLKKYLCII